MKIKIVTQYFSQEYLNILIFEMNEIKLKNNKNVLYLKRKLFVIVENMNVTIIYGMFVSRIGDKINLVSFEI